MQRAFRRFVFVMTMLLLPGFAVGQAEEMTFEQAETAGLCGFRALWNTPINTAADGYRQVTDAKVKDRGGMVIWAPGEREGEPAALAFDAIHRSLLVRFPGAAEQIAAKLDKGFVIEKAELVLPFVDEELWPWGTQNWGPPTGGYQYRANWGVDKLYRRERPTWHAVAWAVTKPWEAHPEHGPTFNAHINGAGYWEKFGAQGESDRAGEQFGPTPVNHESPDGRMDITAALADDAYGDDVADRLRRLSDCGFLVRKWETYDHRYFTGVYEWATATGGRAIIIDSPKLVITFSKDPGAVKVVSDKLAKPADVAALAKKLKGNGQGGEPTAVMPTRDELKQLVEDFATTKPDWMPDWQWQRVEQLLQYSYGRDATSEPFWYQFVANHIMDRTRQRTKNQMPDDGWEIGGHDPQAIYIAWIDQILATQYRGWHGFSASRELLPWFVYHKALPEPAKDWFRNYWTAWLRPEQPTHDELFPPLAEQKNGHMIHPMFDQLKKGSNTMAKIEGDSYYHLTGDWKGNKSFYRSGFMYTISTTNFNNTSSMGALLGGALIDSERAIADGRHGQANFPLKLWTWHDGTTQEELDDYYFAVTVKAQKMVSGFGPGHPDRMMGRSQLNKSMTMLAENYHPGLRRYVAGAARTATHYRLGTQEGLYAVLHTLSQDGVYTDVEPERVEIPYEKFGRELPPAEVARQATVSPYAPTWFGHLVDDKPIPFEITSTFKQWGKYVEDPQMRRTYLGPTYGLYTSNVSGQNISNMAHWRVGDDVPQRSDELGTMFVRFGFNRTNLVNQAGGWISHPGQIATTQKGNRAIFVASPWARGKWIGPKNKITSFQNSVALFSGKGADPTWEIYVDGERINSLPAKAKAGQKITIKDGVSYIAVIPLEATDLGRTDEVVLRHGEVQKYYDKYEVQAALVIDNYIMQTDEPLGENAPWDQVDLSYSPIVVELGSASEHGSFENFQKHIHGASTESSWNADKKLYEVAYTSGGSKLAAGVFTDYEEEGQPSTLFAYQTVDGEPVYLPEGVERDSPFAVQSLTGTLEKGGATLRTDEGQLAFLQHEPVSGVTAAYNPLAELKHFAVTSPEGVRVVADGKVSIAEVILHPGENRLSISHAFIERQADADDAARTMVVTGYDRKPTVHYNGEPARHVAEGKLDGKPALFVSLHAANPDVTQAASRASDVLANLK